MTNSSRDAATAWLHSFASALESRRPEAVLALFGPECFWRDLVIFTWNLRTEEGPDAIAAMLAARLDDVAPHSFVLKGEPSGDGELAEAWFRFETRVARGLGHVRLRQGKAWTLFTAMEELKGLEPHLATRRPLGAEHGVHPGRRSLSLIHI